MKKGAAGGKKDKDKRGGPTRALQWQKKRLIATVPGGGKWVKKKTAKTLNAPHKIRSLTGENDHRKEEL